MAGMHEALSLLVYGPSKAGKALDESTPVLTGAGWKTMKEIEVGDTVHAMDGTLVPVIAVSETLHDRPCYRVTFSDGSMLVADVNHEWTVRDTMRGARLHDHVVLTTAQMLDTYRMDSGKVAMVDGVEYPVVRHRYAIERNIVIERPAANLSIDPWVLGYWLGDGSSDSGHVTVGEQDLAAFHEALSATDCVATSERTYAATRVTVGTPRGPLQTALRAIGVLGDKHIPEEYLLASSEQRMALLQGLMDSDGHGTTDHTGSCCEITLTNERLIHDVLLLIRSLGFKASINESRATLNGRDIGPRWRIVFAAYQDRAPFRYARKYAGLKARAGAQISGSQYSSRERVMSQQTRATTAQIVAIDPVETRPVRCIVIDHPTHTFLAGTDLVMTHNSTLAATAPYPRLLLDVEGGARFLPIVAKVWDPLTEEPPVADGTWDTAVVVTTTYDTMLRAYQWLQSGKHPFKSVIIDSVSELQVKLIEQIAGREQMQMQAWGNLLRQFTGLMRDLRDLTMHPTNPLTAVVLVAMEREDKEGQKRPYLQGQSHVTLPYLTDITGYLNVETFQHSDPTMGTYKVRRLHITPDEKYVAGERVGGRLGGTVEEADLSIERMIAKVYGTTTTTTTTTTSS